ncbi:MAG: septum formation initiator family protein [Deltaproteobacteria bacterium]|nr:septum formation initiator family protein [Deltaproteobacteria bacterium]
MARRIAPFVLSLFVVILLVLTTYGSHGLLHLREINNERAQLQAKNDVLERDIARLENEIQALQTSPFAVEEKAREELGLSRKNEIVYIFPAEK